MKTMDAKVRMIGIVPGYRPSGHNGANTVWGGDGLCPTITGQCAHSNAPLILVMNDEDKNCEYPRMDDGESL